MTKSGHFWITYLPRLLNVVCERPLYESGLRYLLALFAKNPIEDSDYFEKEFQIKDWFWNICFYKTSLFQIFKINCFDMVAKYHISANSFSKNYSSLNLTIVGNMNSCGKFQFLPNKLIFCCRNYLREETIQGRKLYEIFKKYKFKKK